MENSEPKIKAPKSAHIIDLRQSGGGASTKANRSSRPTTPSAPVAKSAAPRRPTAPPPSPPKSPVAPAAAPIAEPLGPSSATSADPNGSASPSRRRFWPAFWRFLLLLIVLGLVVGGGLYIYTHYYAT